MTQRQLSPEHPPTDTRADLDASEVSQLQQEELDRAAGEGIDRAVRRGGDPARRPGRSRSRAAGHGRGRRLMLRWADKDERQYEHIRQSERERWPLRRSHRGRRLPGSRYLEPAEAMAIFTPGLRGGGAEDPRTMSVGSKIVLVAARDAERSAISAIAVLTASATISVVGMRRVVSAGTVYGANMRSS